MQLLLEKLKYLVSFYLVLKDFDRSMYTERYVIKMRFKQLNCLSKIYIDNIIYYIDEIKCKYFK